MEFARELAYLFLIALFITFFVKGFIPTAKIVVAHAPLPAGLKEAWAA